MQPRRHPSRRLIEPAGLHDTGPASWPLAGAIALLLGGIGTLVVAARRWQLARR